MANVTRIELYKLVWSEPMIKVAARFGVSAAYLARICEILSVPRPPRGHWAKRAVGKATTQPPLPEARPGDPLNWCRDGVPPAPYRPFAPGFRQRTVRISRTKVHGLVRDGRAHFENGRPVEEGAYLKPYKKLLVDVTTSKASLDKALCLANDLFNALGSVRHRVVIASSASRLGRGVIDEREVRKTDRDRYQHTGLWSPQRPTVTYVGDVAIGLAVVEMSENVLMRYAGGGNYVRDVDYVPSKSFYTYEHSWTTSCDVPSRRFRIIAYSPYSRVDWTIDWQETRRSSLRSSIPNIVKAIEDAAPELVAKLEDADRRAEAAHQEWLAAQERRQREEDRRKIQQSIDDSKMHLADVIEQWAKVTSVERFLAGVERNAVELPDDNERRHVLGRLRLAREFLGSQDPLDFFRSWKTPTERYEPKFDGQPTEKILG